jgi:hypothetical protein
VDPDHFHTCTRYLSLTATQRHDNLKYILPEIGKQAGFHCIIEPNAHVRPPRPPTASISEEDHHHRHADILMVKHDKRFLIDVAVTHPTRASNLPSTLIRKYPLHSLTRVERTKTATYRDICRENDYQFVPFAISMESYGGMGSQAVQFLRTLAGHDQAGGATETRDFTQDALRRIDIADACAYACSRRTPTSGWSASSSCSSIRSSVVTAVHRGSTSTPGVGVDRR